MRAKINVNQLPAISKITPFEQEVLNCAVALHGFNMQFKNKEYVDFASLKSLIKQINEKFLPAFYDDLIKSNQKKVTNSYYKYLLSKVSKYNLLFVTIHSHDNPNGFDESTLAPRLSGNGLAIVDHVLVEQSTYSSMIYELEDPQLHTGADNLLHTDFDNFIEKEVEGCTRIFADEDQAADNFRGTGHNYIEHYREINPDIGKKTAKRNIADKAARMLHINTSSSQLSTSFWRGKDLIPYQIEQKIFKAAQENKNQGQGFTDEQLNLVNNGKYLSFNTSTIVHTLEPHQEKARHHHVGHAAENVDIGICIITIDPINFECYMQIKDTLGYPRKTEAGNEPDDYLTYIVILTHNHYDHMDLKTILAAWAGLNVLFIVPKNDGHYISDADFKHVVEIPSWNHTVKVTMRRPDGKTGQFRIRPIPAFHASNRHVPNPLRGDFRVMPDINVSAFEGYTIERLDTKTKQLTLLTGDTGKHGTKHQTQFGQLIRRLRTVYGTACVYAGPDRPRSLMDPSHDSSAGGLVFGSKLIIMNVLSIAEQEGIDLQKLTLLELYALFERAVCEVQYYHHSCFGLGLLSYSDVETTFLRMFTELKQNSDQTVGSLFPVLAKQKECYKNLSNEVYKYLNDFIFATMDNFEREEIVNLVGLYKNVRADIEVGWLFKFLCKHTFISKPGEIQDFNGQTRSFEYKFKNSIVNRSGTTENEDGDIDRAYERLIEALFATHGEDLTDLIDGDQIKDPVKLVKVLLEAYIYNHSSMTLKGDTVQDFLSRFDKLKPESLMRNFVILFNHAKNWQTYDEVPRDEGDFATTAQVIYGLLKDDDFRKEFIEDCKEFVPAQSAKCSMM